MSPTLRKLYAVFGAAKDLTSSLWEEVLDPAAMSVDDFAAHVSKRCGISIKIYLVDVENEHIYGHVERYDDGSEAHIYIVKTTDPRMRRLVATKELCQLVLDHQADWQPDGQDTLERLVTPTVEPDAPENFAVRSESMASTLAWELLYPIERRRVDLEKMQKDGLSLGDIARRAMIPVHVVEFVLSPPYMEWCKRWWDEVTSEDPQAVARRKAALGD